MSMTKADIVERIYKEAGFSKKEATELVDLIFKLIKDTLSKGEKVKISGFGNFSIRDKGARKGRNPQSGESMMISARRVLSFKPSEILKEDIMARYGHRLNDKGEENESLAAIDIISKALSSFHSGIEEPDHVGDDDDDMDDEE
jgi:integration host factor subunit alpha